MHFSISVHFEPAVEGASGRPELLSPALGAGRGNASFYLTFTLTHSSRHSSSIQSYHLYFSSMISVWPFSRLLKYVGVSRYLMSR